MKIQVKCMACQKVFWSKAVKNKKTKEIVALDNMCQGCKNRLRQKQMKRSSRIRVIPKEFEKHITMRELYLAEMKRRKEEAKKQLEIGSEEKNPSALLTTPFNTIKEENKENCKSFPCELVKINGKCNPNCPYKIPIIEEKQNGKEK